jgi:hypothetical protein
MCSLRHRVLDVVFRIVVDNVGLGEVESSVRLSVIIASDWSVISWVRKLALERLFAMSREINCMLRVY